MFSSLPITQGQTETDTMMQTGPVSGLKENSGRDIQGHGSQKAFLHSDHCDADGDRARIILCAPKLSEQDKSIETSI